MKRGLHASIWAPRSYEDVSFSHRPAAWTCLSCGFSNFQWRTECFHCGLAIEATGDGLSDLLPAPLKIDHRDGLAGRDKCESSQEHSGAPIIELTRQDFVERLKEKGGLSTSLWAPRNYDGRHNKADDQEVWTRV
jgi:hypothetical protein